MKNRDGYMLQDLMVDITIVYSIGFTMYLFIKYFILGGM
jgi:hypothetical protein